MKRLLLPALLLVLLLGCPPSSDPVTPSPLPPPDTDLCGQMCAHLKKLGCEEGEPVYNNDLPGPEGKPNQSCADNCKELQDKGFFVNPRCVARVEKCEDIEPARQKEPEQCVDKPTPAK